ncbi:MAG: hypothetical protein HY814_00190 [Candidatus Riflebacteria bacterium]|nr:hypothetical protein [Candidatus Riflebacteria bacterium]
MEFYLFLSISTGLIGAGAVVLWLRTRSVSFPLGLAFLYFWSLHGAWAIVLDNLGGESGMHYAYLEAKTFAVRLDAHYLWALFYYSAFVLTVEAVLLLAVHGRGARRPVEPVRFSHGVVLLLGTASALASVFLIRESLLTAAASNQAAYQVSRFSDSPFFTLHQVLNRVALLPAALGLVVLLSGSRPGFLAARRGRLHLAGYVLLLGGGFALCLVLGNKNGLFLAIVAALLFYLANSERPRLGRLAVAGVLGLSCVMLVERFRGVPLPLMALALQEFDLLELLDVLGAGFSSNEAFGAHISMYGALSYGLRPTFGSSLVSLAASIVPRSFWPGRPEDIYVYYAHETGLLEGQGYSIHHATAWYLNFGGPGVVLGAAILGLLWAVCWNGSLDPRAARRTWSYVLRVVAPCTFVAYLPAILRAGPEVYKGLVLEAFFIPTAVLALAAGAVSQGGARPDGSEGEAEPRQDFDSQANVATPMERGTANLLA